jgi:hypothetical protein
MLRLLAKRQDWRAAGLRWRGGKERDRRVEVAALAGVVAADRDPAAHEIADGRAAIGLRQPDDHHRPAGVGGTQPSGPGLLSPNRVYGQVDRHAPLAGAALIPSASTAGTVADQREESDPGTVGGPGHSLVAELQRWDPRCVVAAVGVQVGAANPR